MNELGRELDWNDQISEEREYILLPEGDYEFEVKDFGHARYGGGSKLPPCKQAVMTLKIFGRENGDITITHNIYLHTIVEGLISAFFLATGQKKRGVPFDSDFPGSVGKHGWAHVEVHSYKKKDGTDGQSNQIKYFYAYDKLPAIAKAAIPQTSFTQNSQPTTQSSINTNANSSGTYGGF